MTEEEKSSRIEKLMQGFDSTQPFVNTEAVKGAETATKKYSASNAMIRIQVLLLFGKISTLNPDEQEQLSDAVREEYCKIFHAEVNKIKVTLCDGKSKSKNNLEVVINICSAERILNEGSLQDEFRRIISTRLCKIFPKWMGFSGKVGIINGEPFESPKGPDSGNNDSDNEKTSRVYLADEAQVDFERLQLPQDKIDEIIRAVKRIELEREVFEEWGLYAIMPNPICALNFYGPPGTGKTLAADALANRLNKKIIRASYADIESKYHGEGPKNVKAIFKSAAEQNAILFLDEADSLLSKRLTNVTQGSEQAINSMRSEILICLEKFHGIVIFASNLVVNYDKAFASRLTSVEFDLPDEKMREKIWKVHLLPTPNGKIKLKIPLASDIDFAELAKRYVLSGRTIRNAVVNACVEARSQGLTELTKEILVTEIEREIKRDEGLAKAKDHTEMKSEKDVVSDLVKKKSSEGKTVSLKELESNS